MALKRENGLEQPYIPCGIFKIRIPFVHYRFEVPEAVSAIFMCATCLGAIPVLQSVLGVSYEIAWSMVVINGLLYFLHATFGDPVVPGWVTPAIPVVSAYLTNGYAEGTERIQAMVALQLIVALMFFIMGIGGIANRLMRAIPRSIQAGILFGAAVAAVIGEMNGRFKVYTFSIGISCLVAYFLLFSPTFQKLRKKNAFFDTLGSFGMLPAIILGIIIGPLFGEIKLPAISLSHTDPATGKSQFLFWLPQIGQLLKTVSPFGIGFPRADMFVKAIPTAIAAYIIAFGDFVTADVLLKESDEARTDEKIDFNADRSNIISGVRNTVMALIAPYTQLCGPLWAAVTVSTCQRYKDGRKAMDSIFSGVGTFRMTTAISVAIIPVALLVKEVLPVALSITMLVQGYACTIIAIKRCRNDTDMVIAGVMGAVLAVRGAAWGLAVGIVLNLALVIGSRKSAEKDSPDTPERK
ncbi:MAG: hypothetical protein LBR23_04055 [Spirochaetaceae bacterium]|jgi:hypothetical protein|nr:hypothetical protein [Spirochaetaceae bacterium]